MAQYTDISFLCAYFSYDSRLDAGAALDAAGWRRVSYDAATVAGYKNYFYPEFVDMALGQVPSQSFARYTMEMGRPVSMPSGHDVEIKEISVYVMPFGMALYAIRVDQTSDSLNDFTLTLFRMREVSRWDAEGMEEWREAVINPLRGVAAALHAASDTIVENGNKLKIFQIVTMPGREEFAADTDITLFELGTLGRIGGCRSNDADSTSDSYIRRLLDGNKLSFYNNWCGLALFDTFTMMGYDVKPWMLSTWIDDYFAMIYVHSLFCKFYLFRLNARFRANPGEGERLEEESREFDRLYTFHRISYNFLPGEIDRAIDHALEIHDEKTLLKEYISMCNEAREKKSSVRLNRILTFLAIVTVFSTVWDFSSMLNAMYPLSSIAPTIEAGFRLVVSLTMLIVVVTIIALLRWRR